MGWPKGKKRGPRALMLAKAAENKKAGPRVIPKAGRGPKGQGRPVAPLPKRAKRYATPLAHKQYIIEPCPSCGFPEADGGYCPDCGWSAKRGYGRVY